MSTSMPRYYTLDMPSNSSMSNKQMTYQQLKESLNKATANGVYDIPKSINAAYEPKDIDCETPDDTFGVDAVCKFDLSDEQLEKYLSYAISCAGVPDAPIYGFNIREDQLKKIIDTFLDFEIQTPNNVDFILSLLKRLYVPYMNENILRDTLKRISLFPTSLHELEQIKKYGYSIRQQNYFRFIKSLEYRQDPVVGSISKNLAKEIVFTIFIEKAKELDAEKMIGPNWFRFFEAYYPDFIDQKIFDEYKNQLTSEFILRHPELYKSLELSNGVKQLLKGRLTTLINNELGTYGYPEGLIKVKIQIDNEGINLFQTVNEEEEKELCIGKECENDADYPHKREYELLAEINGDEIEKEE